MGKGIVYCSKCGTILREKEFARGLAHTLDHRHYCTRCRPLATPTLPVNDSAARHLLFVLRLLCSRVSVLQAQHSCWLTALLFLLAEYTPT